MVNTCKTPLLMVQSTFFMVKSSIFDAERWRFSLLAGFPPCWTSCRTIFSWSRQARLDSGESTSEMGSVWWEKPCDWLEGNVFSLKVHIVYQLMAENLTLYNVSEWYDVVSGIPNSKELFVVCFSLARGLLTVDKASNAPMVPPNGLMHFQANAVRSAGEISPTAHRRLACYLRCFFASRLVANLWYPIETYSKLHFIWGHPFVGE